MLVPCRHCGRCLRKRAAEWAARAKIEMGRSARTWFATYTLNPDMQYAAMCSAMAQCTLQGLRWEHCDEDTRFKLRVRAIGPELTKYWKRVRKNSGAPFRYCVVAESHTSGLPHFHALIHEVDCDLPVRHATLSGEWHLGFSRIKLAKDNRASNYVTKYLSKAARARVRASKGYGRTEKDGLIHSDTNVSVIPSDLHETILRRWVEWSDQTK